MRRQYFVLMATVAVFLVIANQVASPIQSQTIQPDVRMELSTTVVAQEYCATDHLRLRLRYRFHNVGKEPIILYKYSTAETEYRITRTVEDASRHRYLVRIEPYIDPVLPEPLYTAALDERVLVSIKAGESYEIDADFHLDVFEASSGGVEGLHPGDYFLQVVIPTWWFGEKKANTARNHLRAYGRLFTKDLTSLPMAFKVVTNPTVVKCALH